MENGRYCRFHYAAQTAIATGMNDFMEMEEIEPGIFIQRKGRIGITAGQYAPRRIGEALPMTQWDTVKNQLIKKGWILYTEKKLTTVTVTKNAGNFEGKEFKPEDDQGVNAIIKRLWQYANLESEESYTYKVQDIPENMTLEGAKIINELKAEYKTMSEAAFNAKLMTYFAYVPRRMKKLVCTRNTPGKSTIEKMETILANEEEKLDFLMDQIRSTKGIVQADLSKVKTITELYGLEWTTATSEEREYVKSLMDSENRDRVANVWRVKNLKTAARFEEFCKKKGLSEGNGISHLWHGSRAQNWWSITTNGLWIKPGLNGRINGSMFGYGLYFAPESDKSLGYTDYGRWIRGNANTGFLALNKVATGKPFYYYKENGGASDECLAGMKRRGTDCLWAQSRAHDPSGRSCLFRDEVIIYDDAQTTIEYLVEVLN